MSSGIGLPVDPQVKPKRVATVEKGVADRLFKAIGDIRKIMSALPSDRHAFVLTTVGTLLAADDGQGSGDAEEADEAKRIGGGAWAESDEDGAGQSEES